MQRSALSVRPAFESAGYDPSSSGPQSWGGWEEIPGFPDGECWTAKLLFIGGALQDALAPRGDGVLGTSMSPRHDLSPYFRWLLREAVREIVLPEQSIDLSRNMPFVVEGLRLFDLWCDVRAREEGRSEDPDFAGPRIIERYETLPAFLEDTESLRAFAEDFAPFASLAPEDRQEAHTRHLAALGGDGGAERIAESENGTDLMLILSPEASQSYGSPRWAVSSPDKEENAFEDYKEDLLFLLRPDGGRHLFHFHTGQFLDSTGLEIRDLPGFMAWQAGLAEILTPWLKAAAEDLTTQDDVWKSGWGFSRLLECICGVPEWEQAIEPGSIQASLSCVARHGNVGICDDLLRSLKRVPAWREAVDPALVEETIRRSSSGCWHLCQTLEGVPEWERAADLARTAAENFDLLAACRPNSSDGDSFGESSKRKRGPSFTP